MVEEDEDEGTQELEGEEGGVVDQLQVVDIAFPKYSHKHIKSNDKTMLPNIKCGVLCCMYCLRSGIKR